MIWITNTQSNLTNQTHRLSQICINPVFSLQQPGRFHILAKISSYPDFSSTSPLISAKPQHSNLFWVTWVSDLLSLSFESDLIWLFRYKVGQFWDLDLFSLPFEIRFWVCVAVYIFSAFLSTNPRIRPLYQQRLPPTWPESQSNSAAAVRVLGIPTRLAR